MSVLDITPITNDTYRFVNFDNNVFINGLNITPNAHPVGRLTIPSQFNGRNVTQIGMSAFSGRSGITSVTLPNTLQSIGASAFSNTSISAVVIPNSVTSIGNNAFTNTRIWTNTPINNVVYADRWAVGYRGIISPPGLLILRTGTNTGTVGIGDFAFTQVSNLKEVEIPNSVTTIGAAAFFNNPDFERIWIPTSVTSIGDSAFISCPQLYMGCTCVALASLTFGERKEIYLNAAQARLSLARNGKKS
jgi:hypothetical protein